MKNYKIKLYNEQNFKLWNTFIANAKNATFLFHRDFMEYHSDRFIDFSMLVFDEKNNLVSVIPANRIEETVFSHQGLTYGGFVFTEKTKLSQAIDIVKSVLHFLSENNITTFNFKQIPSIYCKIPSDELEYISFLLDAKLARRDSLSVINLREKINIANSRKQEFKKSLKVELVFKEVDDLSSFWNEILIPNLAKKHKSKPVHSLVEINKLKMKFPNNIRQFSIYQNEKVIAGTTIFVQDKVAHCQYISGDDNKNENGSVDFLFKNLIDTVFKDYNYFDFGISNENNGSNINKGLLFWKESFGASTQTQNFYEIETKNYVKLENILL